MYQAKENGRNQVVKSSECRKTWCCRCRAARIGLWPYGNDRTENGPRAPGRQQFTAQANQLRVPSQPQDSDWAIEVYQTALAVFPIHARLIEKVAADTKATQIANDISF